MSNQMCPLSDRTRRRVAYLLVFLFVLAIPVSADAASRGVVYRPALTFIVRNAPSDLLLRMDFDRDGETESDFLYMETRLWETYYRLYRQKTPVDHIWYGNRVDFQNATLVAMTDGREIEIPLPEDVLPKLSMNDYFLLDTADFSLHFGLPLSRAVPLFFLRLALTLSATTLVLYLFQYRWKKSWLSALITNLICQGALSLFVANWVNYNPKMLAVHFMVMLTVLILQIPLFCWLLGEEYGKDKSVSYAVCSNLASGALNSIFLIYFPL